MCFCNIIAKKVNIIKKYSKGKKETNYEYKIVYVTCVQIFCVTGAKFMSLVAKNYFTCTNLLCLLVPENMRTSSIKYIQWTDQNYAQIVHWFSSLPVLCWGIIFASLMGGNYAHKVIWNYVQSGMGFPSDVRSQTYPNQILKEIPLMMQMGVLLCY